jgi:hypothetical protein
MCTFPVAIVRSSASRFAHASTNTSPLAKSCTMIGTSPFASHFNLSNCVSMTPFFRFTPVTVKSPRPPRTPRPFTSNPRIRRHTSSAAQNPLVPFCCLRSQFETDIVPHHAVGEPHARTATRATPP